MVRTDVIVLGAGMVGTAAALHLAKAGVSVVLVDRRAPGEETSYGNAGIIESNTFFPYPIPKLDRLLAIALKQATEANYHLSHIPSLIPWLLAYAKASTPEAMVRFGRVMRPLFSNASIEHEALIKEAGAERFLRKNGWLKVYRTADGLDKAKSDLDAIAKEGIAFEIRDQAACLALEPGLTPIFRNGVFWPSATSLSSPLGVTRAYAELFTELGGTILKGDALKLHRSGHYWRIETDEGPVDGSQAVVALGPWAPDLLERFDIKLPLEAKRGYHRHFRARGNDGLSRPVLDPEVGYVCTPMEQGLRITSGAEFAHRDAPPTPIQLERLMPKARELFPIGDPVEDQPWLGSRPCFPDSMPVLGQAPGQLGLWLNYGHAHWGLTLGPVCGRLLTEMMTGKTPFTDPKPYAAERFR